MSIFDFFFGKKEKRSDLPFVEYEFCPRCDARLTLQKGYSNTLPFWNCRGCGEMLINPSIDVKDNIVWVCDKCEAMLNIQSGFDENLGVWICTECGCENSIGKGDIYLTEDEYQTTRANPYKGLTDEEILELTSYIEEQSVNGRDDISVISRPGDNRLYVRKILDKYDISIYQYLMNNPVDMMPRICDVYKGDNNLIVIEEYIEGRTLAEILDEGKLLPKPAVDIAYKVVSILDRLHHMDMPIIHRDVKPSNIIVNDKGEVYLLDVNISKWYKPDEMKDTRLLGTPYFAAPEQLGYGMEELSAKADIYAAGILLNVMVTGKLPKEERATGWLWDIISKCISLDAESRYSDRELLDSLIEVKAWL
ncbi:MAG: protein kinase [Lachnospiraceae bacterium]|nr:protein kinase [Candidatus Colinaster scatohippi]